MSGSATESVGRIGSGKSDRSEGAEYGRSIRQRTNDKDFEAC